MPGATITFNADDEAVQWIALRGYPQKAGQVLEDVSRPGVDGHAYRRKGKRGPVFRLDAVRDCDTLAAADTIYNDLRDRQGTLCSVTTDQGTTFDNVMLLEVGEAEIRKTGAASPVVSSSAGALLRVGLVMQCTQ